MPSKGKKRVFKTTRFAKDAKKAQVSDLDLCEAIRQVMAGQADDLGGGVFKKRLNDNMHRSIVLAKGGLYWVYEYLFAKKDRDNIEHDELVAFRLLAKGYAGLTDSHIVQLVNAKHFVEICHDNAA
jgi:hypothetical protein